MKVSCIDERLIEAARETAKVLRANNLTAVTAESCTAGLVAASLSHTDSASEILHGSFVVYTKDSKIRALGVDNLLLEKKSAVCPEVADQMACGALVRSPATLAIAVTGVLGPDPDEDGNPVGLVYFAVCRKAEKPLITEKQYSKDDPDALRHRVTFDALEFLREAAR